MCIRDRCTSTSCRGNRRSWARTSCQHPLDLGEDLLVGEVARRDGSGRARCDAGAARLAEGADHVAAPLLRVELDGHVRAELVAHAVSYTHLRAHETRHDLVCRLLLEKKKS